MPLARAGLPNGADVDPLVRPDAALALLDEGAGPAEWAPRFALDAVVERRGKLAACPGLPSDVPAAKVLKAVAPHRDLSEVRLRLMTGRHRGRIAAGVATNPDATPALLDGLARHEPPVRKALRAIPRRPRAPATALLGCLSDDKAREAAAGLPALPVHVLGALLTDPDRQLAQAAAATRPCRVP